ncbi:SH3 domain-containing protein [Rummeliibacillus stabekisii]|uniref:SH3 domain-containing protein n=1 Tax=Rummeliibacillus stabekisii TaxID=241244 RepID=UPI0011667AAD|nr:SH3 domain-containing protein [Rummeliibacillus stabekisii]MBB5171597.1 hypothetical protein [Rummeliibacillus stabekisii]GEL05444.1 hypothetical protein RST01_20710 [Rummeliibacillus stabekisii]
MDNSKKIKLKKTLVPSVMTGAVFLSTLGLMNTNASAEINKWGYTAPEECTLVIDKAKNSANSKQFQKSTGVCKKYIDGYYYKKGKTEFYSLYHWRTDEIKYSGELFYLAFGTTDAMMRVFLTNTKENIKGKTMHAAKKLSVYKSASTKAKKIVTVDRYKTLKVISTNGTWAKVQVNGKTGWVTRKYLVNEVTISEVKKVVTKYKVENWTSEQIPVGKTVQEAKGEDGLKYIYYKTTYKNGKLTSPKKKIWTDVINRTQNEINVTGVENN